jgi:hypothetical protein
MWRGDVRSKALRAKPGGTAAFFVRGRGYARILSCMPRLLIATKNVHKAVEIRAILGTAWEVTDLNAHPEVPAPEETGETFAENAAIKAVAASRLFAGFVLSDDSGLEVDALGGAPGVDLGALCGAGSDRCG